MNNTKQKENQLEIVTMTNGSKVEVQFRKDKFISGRLLGEQGNITLYIPETYLAPTKQGNCRKIVRDYF